MCGIGGYIAFQNKRPSKKDIDKMLIGLSERGTDATGVAYRDSLNKLQVCKQDVSAKEFVKDNPIYKSIKKLPKAMILHTRASTKGTPKNNMNNHPIFNKQGYAMVHNGIIYNDDELYRRFKYKRDAMVDSEVILSVFTNSRGEFIEDSVKSVFDMVEGSYAVAILMPNNSLVLFANDNPLSIAYDEENDIMYFASKIEYIPSKATIKRGMNISSLRYATFSDGDYMLINDSGISEKRRFDVTKYTGRRYGFRDADDWYESYYYGKDYTQRVVPYKPDYNYRYLNVYDCVVCGNSVKYGEIDWLEDDMYDDLLQSEHCYECYEGTFRTGTLTEPDSPFEQENKPETNPEKIQSEINKIVDSKLKSNSN